MISSIVWSLSDLPFLSDSAVAVSEKLEVLSDKYPKPTKITLNVYGLMKILEYPKLKEDIKEIFESPDFKPNLI